MRIKIHTPLVLAESNCLAIATVVKFDRLNQEPILASLINHILEGKAHNELNTSYSVYDYIRALTAVYGGIILFYKCGVVSPISRVYPKTGIDVIKAGYGSMKIDDHLILKAWSLIYKGLEEKGLQMISGPTIHPRGFYWYPGTMYEVLATGIEI